MDRNYSFDLDLDNSDILTDDKITCSVPHCNIPVKVKGEKCIVHEEWEDEE